MCCLVGACGRRRRGEHHHHIMYEYFFADRRIPGGYKLCQLLARRACTYIQTSWHGWDCILLGRLPSLGWRGWVGGWIGEERLDLISHFCCCGHFVGELVWVLLAIINIPTIDHISAQSINPHRGYLMQLHAFHAVASRIEQENCQQGSNVITLCQCVGHIGG